MLKELLGSIDGEMQKSLAAYSSDLSKLRTGRAHTGLVENIKIDYYGNETAIKNIASLTVSDARTIVITPWEKQLVKTIEKAIQNSDLGLNPVGDANLVRVPIPLLTEERRKEMVKVLGAITEGARVAVRNVRRSGMDKLKALLKEKKIDEDMERRTQEEIQKLTDAFIENIESLGKTKEVELLKI